MALFVILALPTRAQERVIPRLEAPLGAEGLAPIAPAAPPRGASDVEDVANLTPALEAALAAPIPAALGGTAASATKSQREWPRVFTENFAAPKDHPATLHYLDMVAQLTDSWRSPFDGATLNKAQLEAAEAANVAVTRPNQEGGVLVIPGGDGSAINRWARGLKRNMGVTLLWSPLANKQENRIAAFEPNGGWLWADDLGPLLTKPNSSLLHEFLHAYVDRGKYARQLAPLRVNFYKSSRASFPKADVYADARYAKGESFRSDEILTNFHTIYHRAKGIAEEYGKTPGDWTGSSFDDAPAEVRRLINRMETPLFLSESVEEMSDGLIDGVRDLAKAGLREKKFEKSYGRLEGSIPYVGEVEENAEKDHGFYEAILRDGEKDRLTVRFFTRGQFAASNKIFPVLIGNGQYGVRVDFALDKVLEHDLDDPAYQEHLAVSAASVLAPRLAKLVDVNQRLWLLRKRLKTLQAAGKRRVDLALVREIRDTSKAAFMAVAKYFIRQPAFKWPR